VNVNNASGDGSMIPGGGLHSIGLRLTVPLPRR
jgi:hypothetical protein